MSIYSRSQWTDEEADKLAAEKYVHDMERAHPFPEGCKSDYLAGCTHIRSTVVAPLEAKLAEAQAEIERLRGALEMIYDKLPGDFALEYENWKFIKAILAEGKDDGGRDGV